MQGGKEPTAEKQRSPLGTVTKQLRNIGSGDSDTNDGKARHDPGNRNAEWLGFVEK